MVDSRGNALPASGVRVGWSSTTARPVPTLTVVDVARHPGYSTTTFANDIAVLTLTGPIPGATPLPVASAVTSKASLVRGSSVRSAGYGYTWVTGPSSNSILVADLIALPNNVCGNSKIPYRIGTVDFYGFGSQVDVANAVCAIGVIADTSLIVDTCQGDSGGPLFSGEGITARLVGVVSVGDGCAGYREDGKEMPRKRPGVYARTSSALTWLAELGVQPQDDTLTAPTITQAVAQGRTIDVKVSAAGPSRVDTVTITATPRQPPATPAMCTTVIDAGTGACTLSGLTASTTYELTAVAQAGSAASPPSAPIMVTTGGVPSAPRIRQVFALGNRQVEFVVVPGTSPDGAPVDTRVTCTPSGPAKSRVQRVTEPVVDGTAVVRLVAGYEYVCRAVSTNTFGVARSRTFRVSV